MHGCQSPLASVYSTSNASSGRAVARASSVQCSIPTRPPSAFEGAVFGVNCRSLCGLGGKNDDTPKLGSGVFISLFILRYVSQVSSDLLAHLRDHLGAFDEVLCHRHVQVFDELAVDEDDAFALCERFVEGGDDFTRVLDFGFGGGEDFVAGANGFRVDERLTVEAELFALYAGVAEAFVVREVAVDAIEDGEAVRTCREQADAERSQHGHAQRRVGTAELFGEVVGAHHEATETRRGTSDLFGAE